MGISSLRKLLWVSTSCLQKCSLKLLLEQPSQASLLTFVNSRPITACSESLAQPHWYLWHHKFPSLPKTSVCYSWYPGLPPCPFLELHSVACSSSSCLPTLWTFSKGLFSLHPFLTLSVFTLLLISFTHMVSPQAGTDNPQIFLFCTSAPCCLSLGSQTLQY